MALQHNITHMVRPGRLSLVSNETGTIATVQVKHNVVETRNCHSMQLVGFASAMPIGTDTMAISIGGDQSAGVVIASNHQTHRPKNLATGEVCVYDCGATQQSVYLKADGSIVLTGFHKIIATCDTEIDLTAPTVKITGNLHVTGAVVAGFGGGDQVGLQSHTHGPDSRGDTIPAPTAGS